jgi:ABC-type phosphate transport system substrate-binding protein
VHKPDPRLLGLLGGRLPFLLALLGSTPGCSLLVDRADQCRSDADCARFEGHPVCRGGFCAPSGLGPPGCYFGPPQNQSHYANACSTSQCIPFDNCARLRLCQSGARVPDMLVMPTSLGTVPPLVNPQPMPTVPCEHPSRPNVIYATGSTNLLPLLQAVSPLLAANDPPYVVVYQPQTSCKGAGAMFEADPGKRIIKDIPNNWAFFYDPGNGQKNYCLLHPQGDAVDIGESDVFARTCGYEPKDGVADYAGPIQAITFVVPAASSQRALSAEAAHLVFGTGGSRPVESWIDPRLYFVRSAGTGTIQLAARAIDVPATAWWGIDRLSSDNLRDSLEAIDPGAAERSIGVLSSDFADRARDNLRVLAFQAAGQACGYLPDSSPTSRDKANVRDGHYPIWGPIHLYAATSNGVPSPAADALVRRFSVPRLEQKLLDAIIDSGYIPACAMRVSRDEEMGPMASHQPQFGCGCYYEKVVNGASTCSACRGPADCPSARPACNYGFCEAQPL